MIIKPLLKDILLWGIGLWLMGYILGIVLFMFVPASLVGWAIMPFGIAITLWVIMKKIAIHQFPYYVYLALGWTLIAVICDYFFLVKVFKPADGYYKTDVYIYYVLTFLLPLVIGWKRRTLKGRAPM